MKRMIAFGNRLFYLGFLCFGSFSDNRNVKAGALRGNDGGCLLREGTVLIVESRFPPSRE